MRSLFFIFIIAVATTVQAQWSFSLNSENGYSDNAFANYHRLPDYFSMLNANLAHEWSSENNGSRLFYRAGLNFFKQYRERNSHDHQIGYDYYTVWGEHGNRFDFGVNAGKRYHSETYQWYEQNQFQVYGSLKQVLRSGWYTYLGAMWLLRDYPMLPSFSQHRSQVYGRSSWFFSTGTTLILEVDILNKTYTSSTPAGMVDDSPQVVTIGTGNSQQVVLLARAAQSLSDKIGINAEYQSRINGGSSTRYLNVGEGLYFSDEDFFEDVFAYHGSMWTVGYSQHLPWSMRISLNGRRESRDYDDRPAADLQGEPFADGRLRSDRRTMAWLNWSKRLQVKQGRSPLHITLTWSWLDNDSNDPYYHYKSTYWGLRLTQSF